MKTNDYIDISILKSVPNLNSHAILEIRPLAPLSMVSDVPGSYYKTLPYPNKKMLCGLFENMLGWHFDKKMRDDIFKVWAKCMKKQKIVVNKRDFQQGSSYIPLLMNYFELIGSPSIKSFRKMCYYIDLWNKCFRRSDSPIHLNGCKSIDDRVIADKQAVFSKDKSDSEIKKKWFKNHIEQIPCFYTSPTNREYVDLDALYEIQINIDRKLLAMLNETSCGVCYLGNSEGWVQVDIKSIEL